MLHKIYELLSAMEKLKQGASNIAHVSLMNVVIRCTDKFLLHLCDALATSELPLSVQIKDFSQVT